jgi:hypothetical protein
MTQRINLTDWEGEYNFSESIPSPVPSEVNYAIRISDFAHPQMWVTVMEPGDKIDATGYDRFRTLGYAIQLPAENS